MVIGSIFLNSMIEKKEIRKQVRYAVEQFFTFSLNKEMHNVTIYNVHLDFNWDDNLTQSDIDVRKLVYDKFELIKTFYIGEYAGNDWDLVTQPWVCDLINDLTDCVMMHVEKPKQKGW